MAEAANDQTAAPPPVKVTPMRAGPTITGPQQITIHKLVVETGTDLSRLLEHFGVASLKDLPAIEFSRVVRSLEKRRAA